MNSSDFNSLPFPGVGRNIENRQAAWFLWNKDWRFRNATIRNVFLAILINKQYEIAYSSNRRQKQIPTWLGQGINLLPKMFGVTDALQWKVKKGSFKNEWRYTTRKEIRLATGGDFSDWEITHLLKCLVEFGILQRDHLRHDNVIIAILLRIDAIRMTVLLDEAHEFALRHHLIKKEQPPMVRINVDYDAQESTKAEPPAEGGVCSTNSGFSPCYITESVCASASVPEEKEEYNNIIPGSAGSNDFSSFFSTGNSANQSSPDCSPGIDESKIPDQGAPAPVSPSVSPGLESPAFAPVMLVSAEKARVITLLRDLFPDELFTASRIKEIERLMRARLPAYRMTADRLQRYMAERGTANPGQWQFSVRNLKVFLARWVPILKYLLERETVLSAEEAQGALETSSESVFARVKEQGKVLWDEASLLSKDPIQYAIDYPNSGFGVLGVISRLALIHHNGVDILPALAQLSPELRNTLFDHPRYYFLLYEKLPLRQWARLSARDHRQLMQSAKNQYRECYRQVAVHDLHKPLRPGKRIEKLETTTTD